MEKKCKMYSPWKKSKKSIFAGSIPDEYLVRLKCKDEIYCYDIRELITWFNQGNTVICDETIPSHVINLIYRRAALLDIRSAEHQVELKTCQLYLANNKQNKDASKIWSNDFDSKYIFQLDCKGQTLCYDIRDLVKWLDGGNSYHPNCEQLRLPEEEINLIYIQAKLLNIPSKRYPLKSPGLTRFSSLSQY